MEKNVEMKPGDKVWLFDADHQKIVSEKVLQVGVNAVFAGHFPGHVGLYRPGYDCFSTREALCEHYRKIFK